MTSRLLLLTVYVMLIALPTRSTQAEEPYMDFLQGLRERNYFDTAIFYLDQLAKRPSLPAEMKPVILYEKAITLRENAKVLRNPEKQYEQLDQALAFLEQFATEYPDHANAGDANLDRAQILLQKVDVEIYQSRSPSNKGSRIEFQRRGREFVQKAREVLKLAYDQHEIVWKTFPAFIDELKEPKLKEQRSKVETSMLLEASSLAKCTYQEAQTYDSTSREFKQLLNQAADEFEKVYNPHRTQVGGLHARAWQGKCFEEQGDLQKALGIYNELLDQPGDDPSLQNLKSQTLLFKLSCLHERDDHQLVLDLAEEWLKKNGSDSRTTVGLGIQWEQARAFEALGDNRNLPKPEQERFWRQARTAAQNISRFPSEYKDVSLSMTQRVQVKLGGKERKPEDFETAYGLGSQSFKQAQEIKKELDAATKSQKTPDEMTRMKQDWTNELNEAARNFELAATLVNRRDNQKDVATSRLLHAYTNFYLRRNYEAAILAQFVARTTSDDETSVALDAAYMAMAAFVQAYSDNRAEPDKKLDDLRMVIKAANLITNRWPESEKANEARMILGRMYTTAKQPAEAAAWFSKIPESDSKYPESQLAAGQAYWIAYGASARLAPDSRPTAEKLAEWKVVAEKHLRTGIEKLSATLPKEGAVPQELVSAKIYLSEILLSQGKEIDAAKMLLDDPQSVVKAIAVPDETRRPDKGIQSRSVAKSVYTLLLRAYIGMGNDKLNDAREIMKTLESIAAGDPSSDLTDLYVGLGRMLKSELERFRSNGETERFNKLMEAFESFLDDMFKKQDGQTFGSLSWIGETYLALGEISTDRSKTSSYYDRAASAFNRVVTRSLSEASFASTEQLLNVKVRLVHCNRLKKDFESAEQMLTEVLKARGNDLRTQIEGASVYQDWGTHGDYKKFVYSSNGRKEIGLWGWGGIAKRIQQQKNFADRPDMVDTFLDARYAVSLSRFRYGKELGPKEKQKALDTCAMELVSSSTILRSMPDDKRAKLNELYREVLQESGKTVTNLPRNDEVLEEQPKPKENVEPEERPKDPVEPKVAAQPTSAAPAKPDSGIDTTWIVFLGCLIGGVGVMGWVLLTGGKAKPKKKSFAGRESPVSFAGIAVEKAAPATFSMPTSTPKTRSKPTTASGASAPASGSPSSQPPTQRTSSRPATRPDGSAVPTSKPRPKPPSPPPAN